MRYAWTTAAFWFLGLGIARLDFAGGGAFQFITPVTMAVLFTSYAIGLAIDVERQERRRHEKVMLAEIRRIAADIEQLKRGRDA